MPAPTDASPGFPIEPRYQYKNVTSGAVTVKASKGFLHSIIVNTTAAGTITVFDSLSGSGTKIATLKASIAEGSYIYDCAFATGLTVVLGASSDITVTYR